MRLGGGQGREVTVGRAHRLAIGSSGPSLCRGHGAEILPGERVEEHERDHPEAVEAEAQGVEEDRVAVLVDAQDRADLAQQADLVRRSRC